MQAGQVFAGKYLLEQELGRGGMGMVWLATDTSLLRRVALKVMSPQLSHDEDFRRRFRQEAASAAGLDDHPNVVPVYAHGEDHGVLYLEMHYVAGRDLAAELASSGRLGLQRTAAVVTDVADALDAAHARGLVHRDVKPGNILLGRTHAGRERVLLTDFGLAKPLAGAATTTQGMLGTFAYLSPEQLRGEPATPHSDVYALVCVAFECLAGAKPFPGATAVEVATAHVLEPVPDLGVLAPHVPPAVAAVIRSGLDPEPARRQSSAGQFAAALAVAVDDTGTSTAGAPAGTAQDATQKLTLLPAPDPAPPADEVPPTRPLPSARSERPAARPERPVSRSSPRPARTVAPRRRRWPALLGATVLLAGLAGGAVLATSGDAAPRRQAAAPASTPQDAARDGAREQARAALQATLPPSVYRDCRPLPQREGGGRVASLTCRSAVPGADELLVTQWSDTAAMKADFTRNAGARYPAGKCGDYRAEDGPGISSTWDGGYLACYVNTNQDGVLLYEYEDRAVHVAAVRGDHDMPALFQWWRTTRAVPFAAGG